MDAQEALRILEEEEQISQAQNPPTELFFRAPPKDIEKIPEWTAKGEIVWPKGKEDRPLSQREKEELDMMKEVKLLRQTATLADRGEAFAQGLLPVADKEILEKAFPISNAGGILTRYILQSQVIASKFPGMVTGIHSYLRQPMQSVGHLVGVVPDFLADPVTSVLFSESFPRMVAFAFQRALTWSSAKLGENILKGVTGGDLSTEKLIWEPTKAAGLGAVLGGVHGISGLFTSSLVAAGVGGGKEAIEKYLKDGNLGKEDIGDILLQAGLYGIIEAVGHEQAQRMWRNKEMQDFMYNRWYNRLLGQGQTVEEAEMGASIAVSNMGPAGASLRRAMYEKVIKPELPEQITKIKGETANILLRNLTKASPEMSVANAFSKTVSNFITNDTQHLLQTSLEEQIKTSQYFIDIWQKAKTSGKKEIMQEADEAIAGHRKDIGIIRDKLNELQGRKKPLELPVFEEYQKLKELPAPKQTKGLSTYNQMRYGKALENILKDHLNYTDEDLQEIKMGKSFSAYKNNAMTEHESAKTIKFFEDAIDQAALHEGPQFKKNFKEMDKLRIKYMGAHEKGVFDDVIRIVMPDVISKDIGKDWTFLDWIRPSWRVFRKDPVMYNRGYVPMNDAYAMKERFVSVATQEARSKAKELGLSAEDLRIVTAKRHTDYFITQGQKDLTPLSLNEKQSQWNNWLTKQFEGLHGFFGVERMIPFNMYMPYLEDVDNQDQGILSELYPEYLPKNITTFFEKRRQSKKMDKFRENSLELYEMYIKSGAKKKYMLPAIRQARRYVLQNPNIGANLKSHFQDWGIWMMGYPSLADSSFTALFENNGLDPDNSQRLARFLIDITYMGGIGFRPMSAVRNAFQDLNTACELGYTWTASGWKDFIAKGGTKHAREMGVISEYLPELYSELGEYTKMQKLRDASLFMFRKMDEKNRSIAYYAAENKFDHYFKKYGLSKDFFQKSGINFVDKNERARIIDLVRQGKINEARHIFGKEIVAKTQYLYSKENFPLINKSVGGKILFQFKSWPENYVELVFDWSRNRNYAAIARAVLAYSALGIAGKQLGQKWLTKTIPLGALPIEQWKFERALVPAVISPIADLLFLFTAPLMMGITEQDPDKMAKVFEKRLKALGKDILLYIPGGLAMKDFFKVKAIPLFASALLTLGGEEQKEQPGQMKQLKFRRLNSKGGKLKFREIGK